MADEIDETTEENLDSRQDSIARGHALYAMVNKLFDGESHEAILVCLAFVMAARWMHFPVEPAEDLSVIKTMADHIRTELLSESRTQ